jgi:hypothetical protein
MSVVTGPGIIAPVKPMSHHEVASKSNSIPIPPPGLEEIISQGIKKDDRATAQSSLYGCAIFKSICHRRCGLSFLRLDLDTGLPGCADERQKEAIKPQYPAVFHAKISKTESVKKTGLTLAEPAIKKFHDSVGRYLQWART